jgi:hypothetical protein
MSRVRRRHTVRERPVLPVPQAERQARDIAIVRERMARLFGGSHQLDDAALANLRAEQRADDDAALEALRRADGQ